MNSKMRSSVMGLILGQFSSPLPEVQKEPVAYLYNGVRLPKLPEWDRESYPFAVIIRLYDDYDGFVCYYLHCCATMTVGTENIHFSEHGLYATFNPGNTEWKVGTAVLDDFYVAEDWEDGEYVNIWTNTDLALHDGPVLLKASEPVPVYE